jgi:hypothetical protein
MFWMLAEEHSAAPQAEIATSKLAALTHDYERNGCDTTRAPYTSGWSRSRDRLQVIEPPLDQPNPVVRASFGRRGALAEAPHSKGSCSEKMNYHESHLALFSS